MKKIEIGHGSGGKLTRDLIEKIYLRYLRSDELKPLEDAASINLERNNTAITTDSYVIRPIFFPGGDIGKLSVCGTVNDLVVSGAVPKYLSAGFILEEGFPIESLEEILKSISIASEKAGIRIVTGDTKVVERGKCDGIYINTTGVGEIARPMTVDNISNGDLVIVTGTVGDHGTAIALARDEFEIESSVESDCESLSELLIPLFGIEGVKWMRDPTRGGVATVLAELSEISGLGVQIDEGKLPVRDDVRFISNMLGYDPLYLANEGKAVIIISPGYADEVLGMLKKDSTGKDAAIIGHISSGFCDVRLRTKIGGERVLEMLEEEMLPRIC